MFTGRIGGISLVALFVMSMICFLYLNAYKWTIYPTVVFSLLLIIHLFAVIRNLDLEDSLKKDIWTLAVYLMMVILSNVLWVFVSQWFRYIATISALAFVFVLVTKLKGRIDEK